MSIYQIGPIGAEDSITWYIDVNGILHINGEGEMQNFSATGQRWKEYASVITGVQIDEGITNIGDYAFYNCTALETVDIPDSVQSVGRYAFSKCTSLEDIDFIENVDYIGDYAFSECAFDSLDLPADMPEFGAGVFSKCNNLTEITIPEGWTTTGVNTFKECTNLTTVNLPESLETVGDGSFSGCTNLSDVSIPEGVKTIGESAFKDCTSLEEIVLPEGLETIGASAFYGCNSLAEINIPSTVTTIGDSAFYNCIYLTEIDLPDGLTSIGASAFYGCTNLTEVEIPDTVTSIGTAAFRGCTKLSKANIPSTLTSVSDQLFYGCSSLTSIEIPETVTSIGSSAFYGCSKLSSANIPEAVTSIGTYAFCGCKSLTGEIVLSDNVTYLGQYAFSDCSSITKAVVPGTLTTIGTYAFSNCTSLSDVTLGEGLKSLSMRMFYNCSKITELDIPDSVTAVYAYALSGTGITEVDLTNITTIGECAFSGTKLKEVVVPSTVTSIDSNAFSSCTKLESAQWLTTVAIPASCFNGDTSLRNVEIAEGVKTISDSAFNYCTSLEEIEIPDSVTAINNYAFNACSSLKSIDLSNLNLTTINYETFYNCSSLESVKLPDTLTQISSYAFSSCSSLKSIELPDTVKTISDYAFYQCASLTEITLTRDLTSTGAAFLSNCKNLRKVTIDSTDLGKITSSGVFNMCYSLEEIGVGKNVDVLESTLVTQLKNVSNKNKTMTFEGPNNFTFSGTSVTVGTLTLSAGDYYVDENGNLYKLNSDGTATIMQCAPDCDASVIDSLLTTITDVNGTTYTVTGIGKYAFSNHDNIESITIPDTITLIDGYAFYNCVNLAEVNGATSVEAVKTALAGNNCASTAFVNTALSGAATGGSLSDVYNVSETGIVKVESSETGNNYILEASIKIAESNLVSADVTDTTYTGKSAQIEVSLHDTTGGVTDPLRVYFQFGEDNTSYVESANTLFGYKMDQQLEFVVESSIVYGKFEKAEESGLYYLELYGIDSGETCHIYLTTSYPNGTAGGDFVMWTDNSGGVETPTEVAKATWITQHNQFSLYTQGYSPTIKGDGTDGSLTAVKSLHHIAKLNRSTNYSTSYGVDPMSYAEFSDTLVLPENFYWREGIIKAIKNGDWKCEPYYATGRSDSIEGQSYYNYLLYYVKLDGEWVRIARVAGNEGYTLCYSKTFGDGGLSVDENDNVVLEWTRLNSSSSSSQDINTNYVYITYEDNVIYADSAALREALSDDSTTSVSYTFTNNIEAVGHFTYGDTEEYSGTINVAARVGEGDYTFTKSYTNSSVYMGGSETYTLTLKNDSAFSVEGLQTASDNLSYWFYIKPANIEKMLKDTFGSGMVLTIKDGRLCETEERTVTLTTGSTAEADYYLLGESTPHNGMEGYDPCKETTAQIVIKWDETGSYIEMEVTPAEGDAYTVTIGEGQGYDSVESAFKGVGYQVARATTYNLLWNFPDGMVLNSGESRSINIYANVKNTFMYLETDTIGYIGSSSGYMASNVANTATCYRDGVAKNATVYYPNIYRDASIGKSAYLNNSSIAKDTVVVEGDVIKYTDSVTLGGSAVYDAIPIVDRMYGSQLLIVPVSQNRGLYGKGLSTMYYNGTRYYILDKAGTYNDVYTGGAYADTIVVTEKSDGVDTLMYWYYNGSSGASISYYSVVSPRGEDTATKVEYSIGNEVWAGDHSSHRLYNSIIVPVTRLTVDKYIVTNDDDGSITDAHRPEGDELAKISTVYPDDDVIYRIALTTVSGSQEDMTSLTVTGSSLKDVLPKSINNYWSEDNVQITYIASTGTLCSINDEDAWTIVDGEVDEETGVTQQYIQWDDDFRMTLKGTVYIYITLSYPEGPTDEWIELCVAYGATGLTNKVELGDLWDSVDHLLHCEIVGDLQKGVMRTGTQSGTSGYYKTYGTNTTEMGRQYYSNATALDGLVSYYITLYNDGYSRMYLTEIQDVLPKGFTFNAIEPNTSYSYYANYSYQSKTAYTNSEWYNKLKCTDTETNETRTVSWCKAYAMVVGDPVYNSDGQQVVTFKFANSYNGYNTGNLHYDSNLGMYYLNPGEGVMFVYNCLTNGYKSTADYEENSAAMAIYNYNGADSSLGENISFTPTYMTSVIANDGNTQMLGNAEAAALGIDTSSAKSSTKWLASTVGISRGKIKPGIEVKTTDADGIVNVNDTVTWNITLKNNGDNILSDYYVTDVMMLPYSYTGSVTYTINMSGSSGVSSTLFNVSDLTVDGGEKTFTNSTFGEFTARIDTDTESGNVILTVHFKDEEKAALPASGTATMVVSTKNESSTKENKNYINKAYLTPNSQEFEIEDVTLGTYTLYKLIDTEYDENSDGDETVTSEASIDASYGYATTSYKTVTELSDSLSTTSNTAKSNTSTDYIVIGGADSIFRYTLHIENTGGAALSSNINQFVAIDNLPEVGDHATFYTKYPRYSEFRVDFAPADKLNFTVKIGSTTLSADQYTILFSEQTYFDYTDANNKRTWTATTELTSDNGWYTLEECVANGTLQDMRSVRVALIDLNGSLNLIPASAQIDISFNAMVHDGDEPDYSQIAWNSFGYCYSVGVTQLQTGTENVGVKMQSTMYMSKSLVDYAGNAFPAESDATFRVLIYKGTSQALNANLDADEMLEELSDRGIQATIVDMTVPEGSTSSEVVTLDRLKVYAYDEETGEWGPSSTSWKWENNAKYTVREVPLGGDGLYTLQSIRGSRQNSYTFTYQKSTSVTINVVNERISWKLNLFKHDDIQQDPVANAVFGLYTRKEDLAMKPEDEDEYEEVEEVEEGEETDGDDDILTVPDISYDAPVYCDPETGASYEIEVDGDIWYLMDIMYTNEKGIIQWVGLMEDDVYLLEVKAPEGYLISSDPGQVVDATYGGTTNVSVENSVSFELPESGGPGTLGFTLAGAGLILLSSAALVIFKKKKQEE
jgi:hypothetical protein